MGERLKSKSDLNPVELNTDIPKRSKRQSLSNGACLPDIKDSGELQDDLVNHHMLMNGIRKENRGLLSRKDTAPLVIDTTRDSDKGRTVHTNLESNAELENIQERSDSFVDKIGETKDSVTSVSRHKSDKDIFHRNLSNVPCSTCQDINSKPCAIRKLKGKGNDVLAVIQNMKSVHEMNVQVEQQNKTQCTHQSKTVSAVNRTTLEKCLICEISKAAEKFTSFDTNRFLVEILYPHDFYDKYSRSRRRKAQTDSSTYQIPIIKPVKVVRKQNTPKSLMLNENVDDYQSIPQNSPVDDIVVHHDDTPGKAMGQLSPKSRLFGYTGQEKSLIHSKCREGTQAVFIIENADHEKPQLKGLKGTVRRENCFKEKLDRHISQSMYEVNSLGMQFSLPDYNGSLHNRKPSFSRQITCLSPIQNQALSPHLSAFEYKGYRAMPSPRTLQRGVTFAGFDNYQKLVSNSSHEREITRTKLKKGPQQMALSLNRETTITSSTRVSKIEKSLPPIEDNVLSPNIPLRSSTIT